MVYHVHNIFYALDNSDIVYKILILNIILILYIFFRTCFLQYVLQILLIYSKDLFEFLGIFSL